VGLLCIGTASISAAIVGAYYFVKPGLPAAETIRDISLQIPLRIFTRDGRLIAEIGERRRILVTYEDVPPHVIQAFLAAEDHRFFEHPGVDYQGVLRAGLNFLRSGSRSQGGSTISQQLARDYFLTRERRFTRKIREAFLAYKIEQEFSKQEILTLFLNKMFFGQRAYGVAAAAQVYFNKELQNITVGEAATLAGVLPAPSRYNPVRSARNARVRRDYVLGRMLDLGYIDETQYDEALTETIGSTLYGAAVDVSAPYVAEMVRREMLNRYGEDTYSAGYKVVTTLDSRLQTAGVFALRNGLLEYSRRRGFRGPVTHLDLDPQVVADDYEQWPPEWRQALSDYPAAGELTIALITQLNDDNSANFVVAGGSSHTLPWSGISWARPFLTTETRGPSPKTVDQVLKPGDLVYVMPTNSGNWALAQIPDAQGSIVSLDPQDGAIMSLTGGFDFSLSKFNRAVQAARQPGSSFKPFIYSAALANGNTLATVINDAPVVISSKELEAVWRPVNYTGKFYGPLRMREALVRSINLVSVRLLLFNTGIGNAVRHIAKFGFGDAALPRNGSLALGGGAAAPLDMAQGYAVFANGGFAVTPYVIDQITGPQDEVLYRAEPKVVCLPCERKADAPPTIQEPVTDQALQFELMADIAEDYRPDASVEPELFADINAAPRAISAQNAFLVQDMMRDVIRRGTGRRARVLGRSDLSGKTGTSNDRRDAWFGGYNGSLATIVWVGYDNDQPLGDSEEGSRTALPIWIEYTRIALARAPLNQMPIPEGIVSVLISARDGEPVGAGHPDAMFEYFIEGTVPQRKTTEPAIDIFNNASDTDDLF
jgi:penicillin-binding protein 1A